MSLDVLNLLLVLLAALAGGRVAVRLGYPAILGEISVGILLGPPILGLLGSDDALSVLGKFGVVLLMLYIGLHLDPGDLGKAAKPAAWAAAGGFIVPAALGFGLMMLVGEGLIAATFVAVAMGVTSLATKSRILVDLGILDTRISHVLMAGALFSDVVALIVFAGVLGLATAGAAAAGGLIATVAKATVFLLGSWLVGTKLFPLVGSRLATRTIDPTVLFSGVVLVGLAFAAAADAAGLHAILGAFLAGLFIREGVIGHQEHHDVEAKVHMASVGLLAPIFFVTAGFDVSFAVFTEAPWLIAAVIVLATVGKIVGTALFYLPTGHGFREGLAVGAGMNGRGAVEIIVAELALQAGLINATVFSILVFMAIFTTATVPVLLPMAINWLRSMGELAESERDGVIIISAGGVGRALGQLLADQTHVTVIDTNPDHARLASSAGLEVIVGSGVDSEILDDAGAMDARLFIAATPNSEVNLLAARIARQTFGVPDIHVALPENTPDSVMAMLGDIGAELLFTRPVDIDSWDADVEQSRTVELTFDTSDDPDHVDEAERQSQDAASLGTLPLVVRHNGQTELFDDKTELTEDHTVIALGRPATGDLASPKAGDRLSASQTW